MIMMTRRALLIACLVLPCLVAVRAQTDRFTSPLIVWSRGDLYRVDALDTPPTALTTDGTISGAARSPGDAWIAYKVAAPIGIAALDRVQADGEIADFDLPADLVLTHLERGLTLTIASQPADAALFDPARPDNAVQRSAPSWSPDAAALAWAERDHPSGTMRLVRYDVVTAAARVLALVPGGETRTSAPPVSWGAGGIAIDLSADASSDQIHIVYTPDGLPFGAVGVAAIPGTSVRLTTWVDPMGDRLPYFGLLYENGAWTLIDPAANAAVPYGASPVLETSSGVGWRLRFGVDDSLGFYWEIADSNSAAVGEPNGIALAPDGSHLAVIGALAPGAAAVFDGAIMTPIPGTGRGDGELPIAAVLWGAMRWVLPVS
ncbi:MAG: hypothetical protein SGJ24_18725 [Chloroflexota bacterium]|nr:hypothetical protein [Chloroflexota bacterium]